MESSERTVLKRTRYGELFLSLCSFLLSSEISYQLLYLSPPLNCQFDLEHLMEDTVLQL